MAEKWILSVLLIHLLSIVHFFVVVFQSYRQARFTRNENTDFFLSPDPRLHLLSHGHQSLKVFQWEVSGATHLRLAVVSVHQLLTIGRLSSLWEVFSGLGNPLLSRRSILTLPKWPCRLGWGQPRSPGQQRLLQFQAAATRSRPSPRVVRETRWRLCLVGLACVKMFSVKYRIVVFRCREMKD